MKANITTKRIIEKTITLNRDVKLMMNTVYRKGRVLFREKAAAHRVRPGWPLHKEGYMVVMGHGLNDMIPFDALTLTETTYDEVVKLTKKNVKKTKLTVADFKW